jgi:hypothetical protein
MTLDSGIENLLLIINWFSQPPNETVEKKLVQKMFQKASHNRLKKQQKYCLNVVPNTKSQTRFSVSLPLFKNNFGKVTYSTA